MLQKAKDLQQSAVESLYNKVKGKEERTDLQGTYWKWEDQNDGRIHEPYY